MRTQRIPRSTRSTWGPGRPWTPCLLCLLLLMFASPLRAACDGVECLTLSTHAQLNLSPPQRLGAPVMLQSRVPLLDWSRPSSGSLQIQIDQRLDAERTLRQWRYGLGFDLDLPGAGQLHATLYTRSSRSEKEGPRYRLQGAAPAFADNRWSLGLYVAPVERYDGSRSVALVPQLRLRADRWIHLPMRTEITVEYAPWQMANGDSTGAAVPQLALRMLRH
jgi:hypothetical protein